MTCCSPLGPGGSGPDTDFYQTVQNAGVSLTQRPNLNIINGLLADNAGNTSTDLTLFYQTVMNTDGFVFPQQPNLEFRDPDFTVSDDPGVLATRVRITNPLPSPSNNQDVLAVVGGLWAAAANGFLSFATTALRDAFPGLRTAGQLAYVSTTQCLYMLAPNLTTWNFYAPSPALNAQTAWFVDAALGSDNNSGAAAGAGNALATVEELSRRLCPGGQKMTFAVGNTAPTITLASGSYGELALNIGWPPGTTLFGSVLTIVGNITQSAAITLATVVAENPGTNTSAEITTASGAFVDRGLLVQLTGAQAGSYAYSAGLNGPATDTFTGGWLNFNTSSQAGPAVGNNVATVALNTTIDTFSLITSGKGYVVLQTVKATNGFFRSVGGSDAFNDAAPYLLACELGNGYFASQGGVTFWSCRTTPGTSPTFSGDHISFAGCAFQANNFVENSSNITINFATLIDGGRFQLGVDTPGGVVSVRVNGGAVQHVRGTGLGCWNLFPGCSFFSGSTALWGTRTPYAIGFVLQSGAWVYQSGSLANIKLTTTTTLYQVTGHNIGSGGVPLGYPRANAGVSLSPDPGAVAVTV